MTKSAGKLLFQSSDWNFNTLARTYDAIETIALDELKLDVYPNQMEIISSEQMLDAYSSVGMPLGSPPTLCMPLITSGFFNMSAMSSRIFFTTSGGVPRGTNMPNHATASKPGAASAIGGAAG